jgi:hypothetical protein
MTSEILWIMTTAIAIFFVALLFGDVVLLNLLIAIVSDEFDQWVTAFRPGCDTSSLSSVTARHTYY